MRWINALVVKKISTRISESPRPAKGEDLGEGQRKNKLITAYFQISAFYISNFDF